jgi:hypothetical protein
MPHVAVAFMLSKKRCARCVYAFSSNKLSQNLRLHKLTLGFPASSLYRPHSIPARTILSQNSLSNRGAVKENVANLMVPNG